MENNTVKQLHGWLIKSSSKKEICNKSIYPRLSLGAHKRYFQVNELYVSKTSSLKQQGYKLL